MAELTEGWSPSIWVGYNTMKFDEEVLRQTFYQNLRPSVSITQFSGNTRLDILPAVYAAFVLDPDLFWPTDDTGRRSFKRDRLAPANGFNAQDAHAALGDVEATIHLARQFATKSPELWGELLQAAHKANVQNKLETFHPLQLVTRFGGGEPRAYLGCFCGYSQGNAAQAAFFYLDAADPTELITASDEALSKAVDGTPKILRGISINKAPAHLDLVSPSAGDSAQGWRCDGGALR